MENNKFLSDTVILIDASFLNSVIRSLKNHFELTLGRPLHEIDLSDLLVYFALDGGVKVGDNSTQVVFVYEKSSSLLYHTLPTDLSSELNNVAFSDDLGEFIINSYQPELLVTREELYIEFLKVLLDAKEIKKYIVISDNGEYGDRVTSLLNKGQGKDIVQFRLDEPNKPVDYSWELIVYPIMQALGIKGNELN